MVIAIESLLFLVAGIILAVVLTQLFGRQPPGSTAIVKLVRVGEFPDNHEETQLLINGQLIMAVSDQGLRQADYAADLERLEAIATKIAEALNVELSFSRSSIRAEREWTGRAADEVPGVDQARNRRFPSAKDGMS